MKVLFKSKLILSLITVMLLASAIVGSLAGNTSRANAQAPLVSSTRAATPTGASKGTTVEIPKPKGLKPPEGKIKESGKKRNSRLVQPSLAWSISLSATTTTANVYQSFMLTAQTNNNVGPTPYYIQIYLGSTNYATCGVGTSCSTNTLSGTQAGASYTFYARVSNSDGSGVQAVSNGVTISIVSSGQVLNVPFYTQYAGQRTQNMDCGPTSVAMVLSFYGKGPGGSGAGISQIRIQTGNSSGDTSFGNLERALGSYGSSYSEIPNNISLDVQMSQMRNAVLGGHPVIALIHGATLGRRAAYGDHWLVLRGFSSDGNTVYLQDPDTQSPRWSGWLPGGQITLSYSTFRLAVYQAQFGPSGIIVRN